MSSLSTTAPAFVPWTDDQIGHELADIAELTWIRDLDAKTSSRRFACFSVKDSLWLLLPELMEVAEEDVNALLGRECQGGNASRGPAAARNASSLSSSSFPPLSDNEKRLHALIRRTWPAFARDLDTASPLKRQLILAEALSFLREYGSNPVTDLSNTVSPPAAGFATIIDRKPRRPRLSPSPHSSHNATASTVTEELKTQQQQQQQQRIVLRTPINYNELQLFSWNSGRYIDCGEVTSFRVSCVGDTLLITRLPLPPSSSSSSSSSSSAKDAQAAEQKISILVSVKSFFPRFAASCSSSPAAAASAAAPGVIASRLLGCRVRINDPFFSIDSLGVRGIRVDSEADIQLSQSVPLYNANNKDTAAAPTLQDGKAVGDKLLNSAPADALRAYMKVLRGECATPRANEAALLRDLLAQSAAMMLRTENSARRHREALLAAAFARFIDPGSEHAVSLYNQAHSALMMQRGEHECDDADAIFLFDGQMPYFATPASLLDPATTPNTNTSPLQWKQRGDIAAAANSPSEALECYFRCLQHPSLSLFGNLFSNMTRAASELQSPHVVLITAPLAAFLNPALARKNTMMYALALQQLGMTELSAALSSRVVISSADSDTPESVLLASLKQQQQQGAAECRGNFDFVSFCRSSNKNDKESKMEPVCEFVHPAVAVRQIPGKGRGLVASTAAIKRGDLVLASRALAVSETEKARSKECRPLTATYGNRLMDDQDVEIFNSLQERATMPGFGALLHDIYALCTFDTESQTILTSGSESDSDEERKKKKKQTVEQNIAFDILRHKSSWKQEPFLEPHSSLGLDVGRVIESSCCNAFRLEDNSPTHDRAAFFFSPSFLNHSDTPNTYRRFFSSRRSSGNTNNSNTFYFIFAATDVALGEELCDQYFSSDEAYFSKPSTCLKWGIPLSPLFVTPPPPQLHKMWHALIKKQMGWSLQELAECFDTAMMYSNETLPTFAKLSILELCVDRLARNAGRGNLLIMLSDGGFLSRTLDFLEQEKLVMCHQLWKWSCGLVLATASSRDGAARMHASTAATFKKLDAHVKLLCFGSLDRVVLEYCLREQ